MDSSDWTKYLWDKEKMRHPTPAFYEIDLTNHCNLNCPWCNARVARVKYPVDMKEELAHSIIDEAEKLGIGVVFVGGGEPTLYPKFEEMMEYAHKCIGIGLVSNGTNHIKIVHYLETMKDHKNYWVRLSLNYRPITDEQREMFKKYPNQIGISIIDVRANDSSVVYPAEELAPWAKFIRRKTPSNLAPIKMTPQECIGRKFEKVHEADGTISWCCQARGINGNPPPNCFSDCRWSKVNPEELWKDNPWT